MTLLQSLLRLGRISVEVLGGVWLTRAILERAGITKPHSAALAGSVCLATIMIALSESSVRRLLWHRATSGVALLWLMGVTVASVLFGLILGVPPRNFSVSAFAGVFFPAMVEEFLFRGLLFSVFVKELNETLSNRTVLCRLMAASIVSIIFALSHFVLVWEMPSAWAISEGIRLTSIGMLYTAVALETGMGVAIVAHAAFNMLLLSDSSHFVGHRGLEATIAIAVSGSALTVAKGSMWLAHVPHSVFTTKQGKVNE